MLARPRRRRRRRILIGLTVLAFAGLAWFFLVDEAPSDDSDLRVPRVAVPDAENGYLLVKFSQEEIYWPEEEPEEGAGSVEASDAAGAEPEEKPTRWEQLHGMTSGEKWYPELAAEILQRNTEVLRRLDEAMERPGFQCEEVVDFDDSRQRETLGAWRRLAAVAQLREESVFREGKQIEALEGTLRLVRFGFQIQSTSATLSHSFVGNSVEIQALITLRRLTRSSTQARDYLPRLARALDGLRIRTPTLAAAVLATYRIDSKPFRELGRRHGPIALLGESSLFRALVGRALFKPHQICRRMAEATRVAVAETTILDHPEKRWTKDAEKLVQLNWWESLRAGTGHVVVEMFVLANLKAMGACLETNTQLSLTQAHLAIFAFRAEKGAFPETLDELVPRFLDRVPVDPFGGKSLRYSRQKGLIYSIGSDYVDAGGSAEEGEYEAASDPSEPTLRLEK